MRLNRIKQIKQENKHCSCSKLNWIKGSSKQTDLKELRAGAELKVKVMWQTVVLRQVVSDVLQVELPLIKDQLQDLNRTLSELQGNTWGSEGDTSHDTSRRAEYSS